MNAHLIMRFFTALKNDHLSQAFRFFLSDRDLEMQGESAYKWILRVDGKVGNLSKTTLIIKKNLPISIVSLLVTWPEHEMGSIGANKERRC